MGSKPHVLIAGAGIGGLTAALALLQRGYDVDVYEQASKLAELGAGVQIAANGSRVLRALGLEKELERIVCVAAVKEVRIWNTGQTFKLFDLGEDSVQRFGAPYWFVHRGDLHAVLRDSVLALKPGAVHLSARCVGYENTQGAVRLKLEDGRLIEGDCIVGADGVHSRLRQQMHGDGDSEFTGIIAWRGLARRANLSKELQRLVGTNWVGPCGHVITYPLRGGELMNFVGFGERDDWNVESWMTSGTKEECAADFVNWHPLVHEIIQKVDQPYKWALVGRTPLDVWVDGRVTLMGDASHPTLPFLAQGAIMAIEDGFVLARCLDASHTIEDGLMRFQNARVERTRKIVLGSTAAGQRFHNPLLADDAVAVAYVAQEWTPEKTRTRYDWLFEYDATTAPV